MHLDDMDTVLEFLHRGHDLGLATSTLKVDIAALSVYLDNQLAEDPLIRFFKTLCKTNPGRTVCPTLGSLAGPRWSD